MESSSASDCHFKTFKSFSCANPNSIIILFTNSKSEICIFCVGYVNAALAPVSALALVPQTNIIMSIVVNKQTV